MFKTPFKRIILSKAVAVPFAISLGALSFGCGKRGAPLPPVERVSQRAVINGYQRGNKVNLTWQMPARNAADSSVLNIDRVEIYRLAESANAPASVTEEDFSSRSTLISSIPVSTKDFAKKTLTYADPLDFAGQAARLRYAVRFVNASGQRAAFSNFFLIEPTARIANPPTAVESSVTEDAVIISWTPPDANFDGSKPANVLGYNLYRSLKGSDNFALLNKTPITVASFSDATFEFEKDYSYFLRSVSLGANGQPTESLDSSMIAVHPVDKFPPAAPTAITIAASPNTLSIFFASNTEKDIAGYRIYRSENKDLKLSDWKLLTPALLLTNTFQDKNVTAGKTYFYYLTAVDKFGNVSEPSEIVSEEAPKL